MNKTLAAINRQIEERQGKGFRRHLGASLIGRPCARQLWYTFRWAKSSHHKARLLRLFDRGNLEEERFVRWLRNSGVHVVDKDLETGQQIRIEDHNGHFGGSLDAELFDTPDFPSIWVLGEFKTHNHKSFTALVKQGVQKAKEEHYAQMQVYMDKRGLPAALYFAVNKDNDDLHVEVVEYDKEFAQQLIARAGKIIEANVPPERITENPTFYLCKWCDYQRICHYHAPKELNCRTCRNSRPIEDQQWKCMKYDYVLSESEQRKGCTDHDPIPE